MERERLSEAMLREQIALLGEQEARLKTLLGRVAQERQLREAEFMAVRSDAVLQQRVDDDWE